MSKLVAAAALGAAILVSGAGAVMASTAVTSGPGVSPDRWVDEAATFNPQDVRALAAAKSIEVFHMTDAWAHGLTAGDKDGNPSVGDLVDRDMHGIDELRSAIRANARADARLTAANVNPAEVTDVMPLGNGAVEVFVE
jgi:hypothetical protein